MFVSFVGNGDSKRYVHELGLGTGNTSWIKIWSLCTTLVKMNISLFHVCLLSSNNCTRHKQNHSHNVWEHQTEGPRTAMRPRYISLFFFVQRYIYLSRCTIIWIETKKKQFTKVEGKKKLEKGEERDKWEEEEVIKKRRREVSGWPGNVRRGKRLDEAVTMAPHDPQL